MPKRTPHNREFDMLNFIPDLVSSFIYGTLLQLVVVKIFSTRQVVILVCECVMMWEVKGKDQRMGK